MMGYYDDDQRTQKEKDIDRRASHSLQAIRERQQEKARADHEKIQAALKLAREKAEEARERDRINHERKAELQNDAANAKIWEKNLTLRRRNEETEQARQFKALQEADRREENAALVVARAESGLELERLRHELREAERAPNFEDHRMRAELDFLIRRQERLDQNQIANFDLERRISELRAMSRADIHKAVLLAVVEHIRNKNQHVQTLAELQADLDAEMMKAEQAHGHRIEQDNNASRLKIEEMYAEKLINHAFSQVGSQSTGLTKADIEAMASEWEKEGDRLKK